MKLAYYPGCTAHGSAVEIDVATRKVAQTLGVELKEVEDWNCCGGGFLDERDPVGHAAINLRNLSKVEKMGLEKMVTPCSVCLHSHRLAVHKYEEDPVLKEEVDKRTQGTTVQYSGKANAEHIVWVLLRDVGLEKIKAAVKKPLVGLKVATYYGCQMLRPGEVMGFEDPHSPHSLADLVAAVGATPVTFPAMTYCCGFPLMGSNEKGGLRLAYNIMKGARDAGADLLIHPCSLCHLQLDVTQVKVRDMFSLDWTMPAIYATQLLALAFGFSPEEVQLGRNAAEVLRQKGLI
ncbi:disulfide reductase [Sulfodiicoccus acidiphilus]|uniref:Disulfide reductase n=1 Tax=Sulfodiicoccus acidiphilus TaxID=1670455 RepID=A0A348B3P3_9CREN|nr:CoB--CoM heterodisulfide reductase iron-sulfur subunit B family protein [Sulfodiicoccus acidiphilus]BBD72795.1 disulfide reductase [Sulfodiicoccus acidiphilus]GGT99869.1 disulfide reductase [Sulfodiicoccus acidiphilus]